MLASEQCSDHQASDFVGLQFAGFSTATGAVPVATKGKWSELGQQQWHSDHVLRLDQSI